MRPGQLRVFDGLRLTTEHLNHLQDALRSGVQDLREILGLGVVYRGCEVSPAGDSAVTIQPGLAFDFQNNRLVFDEPKTVPVVFEPSTATQFVCLKYEQIEDGKVEDHFTLLWDSCLVVLRSSLPAAQDNLVILARLDKTAANRFTITDLTRPAETGLETSGAGESSAPDGAGTSTTPTNGTGPGSGEPGGSPPTPETGSSPETPETTPATAGGNATPAETSSTPAPTSTPAPLLPRSWSIGQGIERLTGEPGTGTDLGALLIGPLRNKLATPNDAGAEVRFSLFDKDVVVSFPVLSLGCQTGLAITVNLVADTPPLATPPAASSEAPAGSPASDTITTPIPVPSSSLQVHATTHGEVTFAAERISQFGVSTIQLRAGEPDAPQWTSALTERGVAHALLGGVGGKPPGTLGEVLQHLQLVLRVEQGVTSGFKLVCHLVWNGGASEDSIKALQTHKPTLTWNGFLAWKALGAP